MSTGFWMAYGFGAMSVLIVQGLILTVLRRNRRKSVI